MRCACSHPLAERIEKADMETLYLLIPMSVALVFLIAVLFWWSLRNGQYDDLEGPGYRILMDDDRPVVKEDEPDDACDRAVASMSTEAQAASPKRVD